MVLSVLSYWLRSTPEPPTSNALNHAVQIFGISVLFMTFQRFSIILPTMLHLCSFQSANFQYFSVYLQYFASKISKSAEESVLLGALQPNVGNGGRTGLVRLLSAGLYLVWSSTNKELLISPYYALLSHRTTCHHRPTRVHRGVSGGHSKHRLFPVHCCRFPHPNHQLEAPRGGSYLQRQVHHHHGEVFHSERGAWHHQHPDAAGHSGTGYWDGGM